MQPIDLHKFIDTPRTILKEGDCIKAAARRDHLGLQHCPRCKTQFLYIVDMPETAPERQARHMVELACGNCEWSKEVVLAGLQIHSLMQWMEHQRSTMEYGLKCFREDRQERWLEALYDDHILPEDF